MLAWITVDPGGEIHTLTAKTLSGQLALEHHI